jgi:hypothetical protein
MGSGVLTIALPFAAASVNPSNVVQAKAFHVGFNWYQLTAYQFTTTTADIQALAAGGAFAVFGASVPFAWANNDVVNVGGTYEIA